MILGFISVVARNDSVNFFYNSIFLFSLSLFIAIQNDGLIDLIDTYEIALLAKRAYRKKTYRSTNKTDKDANQSCYSKQATI